jgi:hypothetical protein
MSALRATANLTNGNGRFFINVSSAHDAVYSVTSAGAVTAMNGNATWWSSLLAKTDVSTAGTVILRDMGKTIFASSQSTVYRKVQMVCPTGSFPGGGVIGGSGVSAPDSDYGTAYVELGWYDGAVVGAVGKGSRSPWARTG